MLVSLQDETVASPQSIRNELLPCVEPKPVPLMVTVVPTAPKFGETPVTLGACAFALPAKKRERNNSRAIPDPTLLARGRVPAFRCASSPGTNKRQIDSAV
jgi:hypothetical protein